VVVVVEYMPAHDAAAHLQKQTMDSV